MSIKGNNTRNTLVHSSHTFLDGEVLHVELQKKEQPNQQHVKYMDMPFNTHNIYTYIYIQYALCCNRKVLDGLVRMAFRRRSNLRHDRYQGPSSIPIHLLRS